MASQKTTQVDDSPLNVEDFATKATQKVALDIDDAPFLVDEEPVAPPQVDEPEEVDTAAEEDARAGALRKRKLRILAGLATLFVAIAGAAAWFFFLREVPTVEEAAPSATVIVVPSPATITGPNELPITMQPFLVPQQDAQGRERFLRIQLSSVSPDENTLREVKEKNMVLRDAIYYYLRNKPHEYMLDPANLPTIKEDLLDIINGYLGRGKLEDLFIENYLMR